MTRIGIGVGLLVWFGATLLLAEWRRFSRPSLADRLAPYTPGPRPKVAKGGLLSVDSLGDAVAPLARGIGDRLARLFGVSEALEVRLRRVHSPLDVTTFRIRQLAWTGVALTVGLVITAIGAPVPIDLLVILGAPLLAFLVIEQRLSTASKHWQETLRREIPVVSEQLAMLLNAGFSLGAAINRLSGRGRGCTAVDLATVANRIRQGVGETRALREWSEGAGVDAIDRLVSVLALNAESSDLGRLVSAEARQARRDLQRQSTELIERRSQQVWIPVTVATLVPGVILLAIPFLAALRLFSNA
jgi:tight adherence protein C